MKKLIVLFVLCCLAFPLFSQNERVIDHRFTMEELHILSENLPVTLLTSLFTGKVLLATAFIGDFYVRGDSVRASFGNLSLSETYSISVLFSCVFTYNQSFVLDTLVRSQQYTISGAFVSASLWGNMVIIEITDCIIM